MIRLAVFLVTVSATFAMNCPNMTGVLGPNNIDNQANYTDYWYAFSKTGSPFDTYDCVTSQRFVVNRKNGKCVEVAITGRLNGQLQTLPSFFIVPLSDDKKNLNGWYIADGDCTVNKNSWASIIYVVDKDNSYRVSYINTYEDSDWKTCNSTQIQIAGYPPATFDIKKVDKAIQWTIDQGFVERKSDYTVVNESCWQ